MKLRTRHLRSWVGLLLAVPVVAQADPFPPSSPEEQGLSTPDLELLAEQVEHLVDSEAIVGGELHVIKNRRTVLRRAFGYSDRAEGERMRPDQVYCVRSMTKPLTGTVVQMLLDEGKLKLDTRVAELLPAFDQPHTRAITVEHLLTHTSGLAFSTIARGLDQYEDGILSVANEAAASTFEFEVGTDFQYSDAGTDTLGAIIEVVTGQPLHEVLQERVLDPLGMRDSWTLLAGRGEARARIPSAYSGGVGAWERPWDPEGEVMFPFFLGSQSLYCTTSDYARFLTLWMDAGQVGESALLSPEAIRRGLRPANDLEYPNAFEGIQTYYGQLWMSFATGLGARPVLFGHNGSDGTYAWAWPERDLIVLYFTQSRGSDSGLAVERGIERILFRGEADAFRADLAARSRVATDLADYEGIYWDEDNVVSYYVVRAGERGLSIERPGAFRKELIGTATPGHFALDSKGERVLEFQTPEEGPAEAFLFPFAERVERQVRHVPTGDELGPEQIATKVATCHGAEAIAALGTVRMRGTMSMPARKLNGPLEMIFDATRSRTTVEIGGQASSEWVTADGRLITAVNGGEPDEAEGEMAEQALLGHPIRSLRDWAQLYVRVEVLRTVEVKGRRLHLVRTEPHVTLGSTKIVDAESGRLIGEDRITRFPGAGLIGLEIRFGDYRDIGGGLQLPFEIHYEHQHPFIPEMVMRFEEFEVGVDAEEALTPPPVHK